MKKDRYCHSSEAGLSLIEVLIATSLLTITATAFSSLFLAQANAQKQFTQSADFRGLLDILQLALRSGTASNNFIGVQFNSTQLSGPGLGETLLPTRHSDGFWFDSASTPGTKGTTSIIRFTDSSGNPLRFGSLPGVGRLGTSGFASGFGIVIPSSQALPANGLSGPVYGFLRVAAQTQGSPPSPAAPPVPVLGRILATASADPGLPPGRAPDLPFPATVTNRGTYFEITGQSTTSQAGLVVSQAYRQDGPPGDSGSQAINRVIHVVRGFSSAFVALNDVTADPNSRYTKATLDGVMCDAAGGWHLAGCWGVGKGTDHDIFPYPNGCVTNDFDQTGNVEISITCIRSF